MCGRSFGRPVFCVCARGAVDFSGGSQCKGGNFQSDRNEAAQGCPG